MWKIKGARLAGVRPREWIGMTALGKVTRLSRGRFSNKKTCCYENEATENAFVTSFPWRGKSSRQDRDDKRVRSRRTEELRVVRWQVEAGGGGGEDKGGEQRASQKRVGAIDFFARFSPIRGNRVTAEYSDACITSVLGQKVLHSSTKAFYGSVAGATRQGGSWGEAERYWRGGESASKPLR